MHESVLTLLAIDQAGSKWQAFAPDDLAPEYDSQAGQETGRNRNMLTEAARSTRGRIQPLDLFDPAEWDALVIPGGTGVARNLSNWAIEGPDATVRPDVRKAILGTRNAGKPIGLACIAPRLGALLLPGVQVRVGVDGPASQKITAAGAVHVDSHVTDAVMDARLRVVSCPAYMDDSASISQVMAGIDKMVAGVIALGTQN